jgi:hypothetical protein
MSFPEPVLVTGLRLFAVGFVAAVALAVAEAVVGKMGW